MSDRHSIEIDDTLPFYEVRKFLAEAVPGSVFDAEFAKLLRLPAGPPYSTSLNAVVGAISARPYWWHISHIEASVIPTSPVLGAEDVVSNSHVYDREGRPISYRVISGEGREAWSLCRAWIKSAFDLPDAFYVDASAIDGALAKEPCSRKEMMMYYRACENIRQEAIRRFEENQSAGIGVIDD